MRLAWWAALLLATTVLSGCSTTEEPQDVQPDPDTQDDPNAPDGSGPDTPDDPDPDDGQPDDPEPDGNTPPTASLTADVSSGTAPLNVTFTIDGNDPDGDALSWQLDADGDGVTDVRGDALPETATFRYDAGTHTAILTVSDGSIDAEARLRVVANATMPEPDPEAWAFVWPSNGGTGCDDPYMSLSEESSLACGSTFQPAAAALGAADELLWITFPADAGTQGHPAGTPGLAEITVFVAGAVAGTLHGELLVDDNVVGSATLTLEPSPGVPGEVIHQLNLTTSAATPAGAVMTFRYAYETAGYIEITAGHLRIG